MLENIRQIGIFMIIAQTMMHFAAGKQYEKYMKIIAGVIVILQFIRPFLSNTENIAAKWEAEAARMMQQIERQSEDGYRMSYAADPVQATVLTQLEEEIKNRLNEAIGGHGGHVTAVAIELSAGDTQDWVSGEMHTDEVYFERIRIRVRSLAADGKDMSKYGTVQRRLPDGSGQPEAVGRSAIRIGEITVTTGENEGESDAGGDARNETPREGEAADLNTETQEFQQLFAQTLGIAEDRVEVVLDGEW